MGKLYEILGLAQYEAEKISSSPRDWLHYLDTASQLYRYSFSDTLLIHAQRPGATACAELEIWNHKMKRWVNRGAKGIALIDDRYPKKRLRYVFDVSDTHKVQGGKTPYLWQLKEHQKEPLLDHLSEVYGLAGEDTVALTSALWKIARDMTEENLEEAMEGLEYEVEGTFLEDLDEQTIQTEFRELLQNSIFYSLSRRCGLDPMDVLEEGDFTAITDFRSMSVLPFLGNATNQIVEPILQDIGRTVWRMDWEEQKEKSQKRVENSSRTHYNEFNTLMQESKENGGNENGTDILSQRGLPVSEPDNRKRTSEHREVRNASEDIPEGKPEELVSEHASDRKIGETSDGNRESSTGENGSSDEWTSYSISGSGQGGRPDEVGGTHEQSPADGRGERFDGIGIQLSEEQTEQDFDGAEEEIASALSLPQLPPVEKQIREIEERQAALYAKEVTIPAEIVDEVLRYGGNRTGSHLRIIYNFMIEQPEEAYTEFVQKEYGKGGIGLQISGREYAVWYDELGMQIAVGHTVHDTVLDKVFLSWEEASGRIHQLLRQGEYAPQVVLDAARENALKEHADALIYMERDMAEGVAELVFEDTEVFHNTFPTVTEKVCALLEQPGYLADLNERLEALAEYYQEDKEIMRFHFYRPDKVLEQFQKFAKEAVPYQAREGFAWEGHPIFITQDEIDAFLVGGGSYRDGRLSTYAFFIQDKSEREKADFVKESYGIGGRSHALSGADHSHADYDSKGLKLERGSYSHPEATVFLKWTQVAKRIEFLIDQDFYLKAADYTRMPSYEREQMANRIVSFYYRLPKEIERPFSDGFFGEEERQELPLLLEQEETAEELVKKMDEALAALPLEFENYEKRVETLAILHQYIEGTYTLFPERQKEISVENENQQLSLFDFMQEEPFDMEKLEEQNLSQPANEVADMIDVIGTDGEIITAVPQKRNQTKEDTIPQQKEYAKEGNNFRITDDALGVGSPKEKFRGNIEAISLLKKLEAENRLATPEEQEILSRYVGWGGLSAAFDDRKEEWSQEYQELKGLLSESEYKEARSSTLNAFYTPPTVIKAMYQVLENMGLSTGNVLEPSCGVGNFMGLIPENMQGIQMYGVELDPISGKIAGQLYQKNRIEVKGFEKTEYPESFFDCVIGNVPFGNYQVSDRKYDKYSLMIHDYFIVKSLDLIRPGGVVAVITSSRTMDKESEKVRLQFAEKADLLGAIRLPENAFRKNAGTDVVSDILFFQKRDRAVLQKPSWVEVGETEEGYKINSYFVEHPEMVLGDFALESNQYGRMEVTVKPRKETSLEEQLKEVIPFIQGQITVREFDELDLNETEDSILADPSVKNFSFAKVGEQVYYRENSRMNRMDLPAVTTERVIGMIEIRDITRKLIDSQMEDAGEEEIKSIQKELNQTYDTFTEKYGLLNSAANRRAFSQDSSYCLLASLEFLDEEGKLKRKADIFHKRTIRKAEPIERVDTASEALALSLAERAKIDLSFMTELTGKPEAEIIEELTGVIFQNPLTEKWETSDEYLSGNVRVKLEVAKQFAENHDRYQVNVQALEKVQPKELEASEIEIRLGATWVDAEYITEFMGELFQTPDYYLGSRIEVKYAPVNGQWNISGKSLDTYGNTRVTATYGTARANAYRLLEDALNLRDTKIYDTIQDADGEHRVLNKKETMLAQQKQDMIKEAFKEWIFRDIDRREALCKKYNEIFNSVRPREYDGSHIQFVGMTPEITLMPHQKNAVAHVLYGGNTLLAHCVGAGKTFQMIAAGMESKRLGLSQKNLYVVPNHLTEQWGSDFLRLYPGANVLVATKKDFEPANRKKFCSRIATGDYDAIIIGHSQFEHIPLSKERQMAMIEQQIEEIMLAIKEAQSDDSPRYTIKQMEKTRKGLEKRLEKLNDDTRKDDVVTFEQLGVDRLFVDESHFYKNLFLYTKMRNIAGIAQTDAQKSSDMFMKCRYMDELTGGKGVTFATGTPVSNSMTELYTIMRYLQYDTLQKLQLGHFDSWAATFGETVTAVELSPEGTGYRAKTRFARFFNLPELISLFKESADIQTADMLHLPVPEAEYINEVLKPSEEQQELVAAFGERAEIVRGGGVDASVDNMLKITNDGRKCALDQRLINDMLPDYEDSKINRCVENTFSIWEETKEQLSTQLIFCDLSTPKSDGSFNVYDDIREKLVTKGIPKEEIVFIHEAGTEIKKAELFAKVRSGQVRVLLGSTPKLGAGTNIQDRLIALHHLDCPWKPADLEQQEGRILRQGNQNKKVKIFRYVTENTFDAYMWQILENKQKFISQIMTSKSPVRACEDVDDTALSYAEIKALATGNPYIKEKMDLDIQVSKLKLLKANHTSQKYKLETDIAKNYPMQIAAQKERLAGLRSDAEAVRPIFENEDFSMIVSNKTFTDKKEAGTALLAACEGLKAIHTEGKIGTFHDFSLYAKFDAFNQRYIMTIKRKCSYLIEMGKDILGNLQRISNALGGIEKKMEETEQKLETLQKQLETAQEEAAKPFPKEKELQEKMERLAELNYLLNMDEKEMPQDQEKEVDQVADLPRRSVNYAGRVSEGRKGKIEKSSVLGRLKTTQRNMEKGWKNRDMQKKKQEQQL